MQLCKWLILLISVSSYAQVNNPNLRSTGAVTVGHCVQFNSATIVSDAGAACGGSLSITSGEIVYGTGSGVTSSSNYIVDTAGLDTPSAPTLSGSGATGGSTAYAYTVTAFDAIGHSITSSQGSTSEGQASLSSMTKITLTWPAVARATYYLVARVNGPADTGTIGFPTAATLDDTGQLSDQIGGTTFANTSNGISFGPNVGVPAGNWQVGAPISSVDYGVAFEGAGGAGGALVPYSFIYVGNLSASVPFHFLTQSDSSGKIGLESEHWTAANVRTIGVGCTGGYYGTIANTQDIMGCSAINVAAITSTGNMTRSIAMNAWPFFNDGSGTLATDIGFFARNRTGATNNYGFYTDQTSGSMRWAFYGAGTAISHFGGAVEIASGGSSVKLVCWKSDGITLGYATMLAGDISACN